MENYFTPIFRIFIYLRMNSKSNSNTNIRYIHFSLTQMYDLFYVNILITEGKTETIEEAILAQLEYTNTVKEYDFKGVPFRTCLHVCT